MATTLPNRARVTYTYGNLTDTVLSNTTNTTLTDPYTMSITKTPVVTSVAAGDTASYVIRLENTGTGVLYNPTVTDDLGKGTSTTAPLSYETDSAQFYINGTESTGTAATSTAGVVFTSASSLDPGDNLIIVYAAEMSDSQTESVANTATASANSGSAAGALISATAASTVAIDASANVSVFKAADKASVAPGDTLTYTFTMMNTGSSAADSISFVDALPTEFTVTSVSYTANGVTTTLASTDYSITAPNTLTVPASDSLVIGVPAATADSPGITVITVTGTVA